MKKVFKKHDAVVVLADLSTNDQRIWKELSEMGFGGLPVNQVYPGTPGAEPDVLPTNLTTGIVEEAIEQAAKKG